MNRVFSVNFIKGLCAKRLLYLEPRFLKSVNFLEDKIYFSTSIKSSEADSETDDLESASTLNESGLVKSERDDFLRANQSKYLVQEGASPSTFQPAEYLGDNGVVFPMNPLFKHSPPITNAKKQQIFEAYLKDPETNTLRKLAVSFKISIRRVEAILKLKHLEQEMSKNGFVPLKNYQTGMEKILNAGSGALIEELEPILPRLGKPLFRAVDEEVDFTSKDAAEEMKRPEFSTLTEKLLEDRAFEYRGLSGNEFNIDKEVKPAPLAVDSVHGCHKKFQFMFSDINPKLFLKERTVLVREKNGVLRAASKLERIHYARRTDWPNQRTLFKRTIADEKTSKKTSYNLSA